MGHKFIHVSRHLSIREQIFGLESQPHIENKNNQVNQTNFVRAYAVKIYSQNT